MNYRHIFHAGNFADVFKHALLTRILLYLVKKPAALRFVDTHAGLGYYDLSAPEAEKTGEWRTGIGLFERAALSAAAAELFSPYLDIVRRVAAARQARIYPGSPAIAAAVLRPQDRLILCELHPQDAGVLRTELRRERRAKAIEIDGYVALNAYVPPPERRGLVMIDPPFESRDEFVQIERELGAAYAKWPTGIYAVWYPLKQQDAGARLCEQLARSGIKRLLRLEFAIAAIDEEGPLTASGLIVVNPPFVLESEAQIMLPVLRDVLGRDRSAMFAIVPQGLE